MNAPKLTEAEQEIRHLMAYLRSRPYLVPEGAETGIDSNRLCMLLSCVIASACDQTEKQYPEQGPAIRTASVVMICGLGEGVLSDHQNPFR